MKIMSFHRIRGGATVLTSMKKIKAVFDFGKQISRYKVLKGLSKTTK